MVAGRAGKGRSAHTKEVPDQIRGANLRARLSDEAPARQDGGGERGSAKIGGFDRALVQVPRRELVRWRPATAVYGSYGEPPG